MSPQTPTSPIDEYGRYPGISRPALPCCETEVSSEGRVQILVEFFNRVYRNRRKGDDGGDQYSRNEMNNSSGSDCDVIRTPGMTCAMGSPIRRDDSMTAQECREHRKVTLSDLGASTLLPSSIYLLWRVFVLLFSCMVMTWTTLLGPSLATVIPMTSSILSFITASKMVFWTLLYRRWRANHEKLKEESKEYRWDALIFQANFHISFTSVVALLICSVFGKEDGENHSAFLRSNLGFYLLLVNAVVLSTDVLLTPIPFHFVSVVIAAVIVAGLTFITLRPSTTIERQTGVLAVGATSLVVGSALHVVCSATAIHSMFGKGIGSKGRDDSRDEEAPRGVEII